MLQIQFLNTCFRSHLSKVAGPPGRKLQPHCIVTTLAEEDFLKAKNFGRDNSQEKHLIFLIPQEMHV
jgi:hypothetical protein